MIDIKKAIDQADKLKSKLTPDVMSELSGLSSPKVRHLLNNLSAQSKTYLEVGCYLGGTLRAALHGNTPDYAAAVDNFSMMPDKREEFFKNTSMLSFEFFEEDSFKLDVSKIKRPIELYFYDGHHSFESQCLAISHFQKALASEFVYICDDWDMKKIPNATITTLRNLKFTIDEVYELKGGVDKEWWGGIGILKVRK